MATNPFATATKKTAATTKKGNTIVLNSELSDVLSKYVVAKDTISSMEGIKTATGEMLLASGFQSFIELAEQQQKKPDTITLQSTTGESVKLIIMDKFKGLEETEVTEELKPYVETKQTFKFNPEILDKHMDVIGAALAKVLPASDLEQLLIVEEKIVARSGSIDAAIARGDFNLIQQLKPVMYVK